jgi:hypothetical protein
MKCRDPGARHPATTTGCPPAQLRVWMAYMHVQLRMNYEINRQLHAIATCRWPTITCA